MTKGNGDLSDVVVLCLDCGREIPEGGVIGCPDGAEICHDCFDQGRH